MLGWNWAAYNTITSTLSNPSNSAAIKMSGTITPNLLVEASLQLRRQHHQHRQQLQVASKPCWMAGVRCSFNNGSPNLPGINVNGPAYESEQTGYGTWHNAAEDYSPKVDISYTKGKHAMKYGFSYNRYTKNQQLQADPGGDFGFSSNQTGDAWISLVLGLAANYSQAQHLPIRHYVNNTTSAYVNDNWKVTPRLNLQLGFRYDALPHAWERNNQVGNFDPTTYINQPPTWNADGSIDPASAGVITPTGSAIPFYLNGIQVPGQNGYPHGVVTNDYNTAQPRVGFSYDLTGAGRTVLRGGFGTFFERLQGNDIYALANGNVPFQYTPNLNNTYFNDPHCSWSSPTSACLSATNLPILPAGLTSLAKTYKAPGVAQFSLGIQHQIAPSVILVTQYVGNVAWHQNIVRNINTFPLDTPYSVRSASAHGTLTNNGNANAFRTYQGFGGIAQEENTTNGNYSGFQAGLRLQNKWGLSGELDYTYSHAIDDTPNSTDLQTADNPFYLKYDKAGGAFDRRHILQANYIYRLPIFNKSTGLTHTILGGWEVAGTAMDETGVPYPAGVSLGTDSVGLGGGYTVRADVVSKIHYHHKADNWFDTTTSNPGCTTSHTAPLCDPVPGYQGGPNLGFGNGRRDTFVGPGRVNFDTSLYKTFALGERAHLDFRAESYNTFNHTEFNNIGTTLHGNQYGVASGTWDPRVLQFGGKFVF